MIQAGQQWVNGRARSWEILAEPMTIHCAAIKKDGTRQGPCLHFEKNFKRVRDRDWPAAGAIGPKCNTGCNILADAQESDLAGSIMTRSHLDYGSD